MDEQFPILIAEDDENDAIILERALRKVGLSIHFIFAAMAPKVIAYLCAEGPFPEPDEISPLSAGCA